MDTRTSASGYYRSDDFACAEDNAPIDWPVIADTVGYWAAVDEDVNEDGVVDGGDYKWRQAANKPATIYCGAVTRVDFRARPWAARGGVRDGRRGHARSRRPHDRASDLDADRGG